MRGVIACIVLLSGTAAADEEQGSPPWGVDVSVGGTADSEVAASGHAAANGWLARGPDGGPALSVDLGVDLDRVPWLSAPRELAASPYSAATAGFRVSGAMKGEDGARAFGGCDFATFPVEMFAGVLSQDGRQRRFGGGSGTAMNMCWDQPDGEPTCVGWFGGRAAEIRDEARSYGTVVVYLVPVSGLRLGPVRVDAILGGGSASRSILDGEDALPEFHVSAFRWDVRVRGRAGDVDLALASRREPYASTDGAMSFEDRVEAIASVGARIRWTATAYAARTRWWFDPESMPGTADTLGAELAVSTRVAGFDLLARGAVGRSFYPALDETLPEIPALGARVTVDVQRTFTVYER